jgi:hypothetical protein
MLAVTLSTIVATSSARARSIGYRVYRFSPKVRQLGAARRGTWCLNLALRSADRTVDIGSTAGRFIPEGRTEGAEAWNYRRGSTARFRDSSPRIRSASPHPRCARVGAAGRLERDLVDQRQHAGRDRMHADRRAGAGASSRLAAGRRRVDSRERCRPPPRALARQTLPRLHEQQVFAVLRADPVRRLPTRLRRHEHTARERKPYVSSCSAFHCHSSSNGENVQLVRHELA